MKKQRFQNWFNGLDEKEKKQVIFKKACFYLGRRDYAKKELERKLLRKYGSEFSELIGTVLDYLEEKGWQSDERFKEVFVRSKIRKGIGPRRIRRELKMKGISETYDEKMEETDFQESAEEEVSKKYSRDLRKWEEMEYDDKQKLRAKINRFLAYRGLPFIEMERVVAKAEEIG